MEPNGWVDSFSGTRLSNDELSRLRERAHRVYERNAHVFEDEFEALAALGVTPLREWVHDQHLPTGQGVI